MSTRDEQKENIMDDTSFATITIGMEAVVPEKEKKRAMAREKGSGGASGENTRRR